MFLFVFLQGKVFLLFLFFCRGEVFLLFWEWLFLFFDCCTARLEVFLLFNLFYFKSVVTNLRFHYFSFKFAFL